jgi:uncharacterized protein (DUF849 family)
MAATIETLVTLKLINCCTCGVHIALSEEHEYTLRQSHNNFYCPSGHPQRFARQTEAEQLRKALSAAEIEKTRLAQQIAAAQAETERLQKRVAHGVCPCCNRTFKQLNAHMARKHPAYGKE